MANSIGIKLQIDDAIRPRDYSLGTKLIIIIPQTAKTVRDVKDYIAGCVLKTPVRLNLYLGEFRIRDEEDVVVFTCFPEVCIVSPASDDIPTPSPKGSTKVVHKDSPLKMKCTREASPEGSKEPKAKKVKFNDTMSVITSSPLPHMTHFEGFDQIDESNIRYPADDSVSMMQQNSSSFVASRSPGNLTKNILDTGMIVDDTLNGDDLSNLTQVEVEARKKRRRRRHRKNKKLNESNEYSHNNGDSELSTIIITEVAADVHPFANNSSSSNSTQSQLSLNATTIEENNGLNESCFADNELDLSADGSFKKPQPRSILKRKEHGSVLDGTQSPVPTDTSTLPTTPLTKRAKTRVDTPILPRVLKNPRIYEQAQQSLRGFNLNSSIAEDSENGNQSMGSSQQANVLIQRGDILPKVSKSKRQTQSDSNERDDAFYELLKPVNDVSEIGKGDVIAFKTLEIGANYCPELSAYKEVTIKGKEGNLLSLEYIRGGAVPKRDGIFELNDEEYSVEPLAGTDELNKDFSSMSYVKIVSSLFENCPKPI